MVDANTDRNLLFGVLALQLDLIDARQFADACSGWAARREMALGDLLVERGWITPEDRDEVGRLLARKLKKHAGDVRASLAEAADDRVRSVLADTSDPEVARSLAELARPEGHILLSTIAHEAGSRERYTLTRLHAQGGIGRVWLARDADLGRNVALKELRPERSGNPIVWARFLEEAKITGQLEHPNIVPVHELVRPADGNQPFYTMRFVRGRTLSEAARAYHQGRAEGRTEPLELQALLQAFVGVCNAVAYAHSRGVIHRDLKGQNVVLGDYGEVVVLDWGLAKLIDRPEQPETLSPGVAVEHDEGRGETLAGQALGTPAYMAPEQAEGRWERVDGRSDVYGLGAILYEVLAGEPPFAGTDTAEVLRKVVQEPPRPPRAHNPGAPRPLEAVCLKALAKRPEDRYGSARELADDVRHHLADEPVSAYREPFAARFGRWARRHRPVVAGAAALLIAAVLGLTIGTVLLGRANARIEEQRRVAQANYRTAEANFRQARAAVDEYFTLVSESKLLDVPGLQPLRKDLLEAARRYYDRFVRERSGDRTVRGELGKAVFRVGLITDEIVGRGEALAVFEQARGIQEGLARDEPASPQRRADLAETFWHLGDIQRWVGRLGPSLDSHRRALEIREALARAQPEEAGHRRDMARSESALAELLGGTGRYQEGLEHARRAVALGEDLVRADPASERARGELAASRKQEGALLAALARWKEAERTFRRALEIQEGLVREAPRVIKSRSELAWILHRLGLALNAVGRRDEGLAFLRRAMEIRRQLVEENPDVFQLRHELCGSYVERAFNEGYAGRHDRALLDARRASDLQREVVRRNPDNVGYRATAANCDAWVGWYLLQTGRDDEARRTLEGALGVLDGLIREHPDDIEVRWSWNRCCRNLKIYYKFSVNDLDEALRHSRQNLASAEYLARLNPDVLSFQWAPADALHEVGILERETGHPDRALESLRRSLEIKERLAKAHPESADLPGYVSMTLTDAGITLRLLGRTDEALASFLRAADVLEALPEKRPYNHYSLACAYAQASAVAGPEAGGAGGTSAEVRRSYADRAVDSLRRAIDLGFIDPPRFRNEVDLDPIRPREDFRLILLDLAFPQQPFAP